MTAPNIIALPVRPARVIHRYRAAHTQAQRAPAGHILPAGGEARPDSSLSGRAAQDDPHRLCGSCWCAPCECRRGTMGGDWIGRQVARGQGFDAAAYRAARTQPARLADLRNPARVLRLADVSCRAWVLITLAALVGFNLL